MSPVTRHLSPRTHRLVQTVTQAVEDFKLNTAIAGLMEHSRWLAGQVDWLPSDQARAEVETLVHLLAPFAPFVTEEIWARGGHTDSIHQQPWPTFDPALAAPDTVEMAVQVNGRVVARITVPADWDEEKVRAMALAEEAVQRAMEGKAPTRIIIVPGRLMNIVV